MSNIVKRQNSQTPATFGSVIDQLFQTNLNRFFDDNYWGFNGLSNRVPVNIRETEKNYELELVAPGLQKEAFQLTVDKDFLIVAFEEKQESNDENKQEGWLRQEFQHRSFTRSFNLNETIDSEQITARYQDGVLYVTLPKKENAQKVSRQISIQ